MNKNGLCIESDGADTIRVPVEKIFYLLLHKQCVCAVCRAKRMHVRVRWNG